MASDENQIERRNKLENEIEKYNEALEIVSNIRSMIRINLKTSPKHTQENSHADMDDQQEDTKNIYPDIPSLKDQLDKFQ